MDSQEEGREASTVALQSNIYPVIEEFPYYDKQFLHAIHDPVLLQLYHDRYTGYYGLTPLQEEERTYAIHCMYAEEGDYPWGTVLTDAGERVVCKCENYACRYYAECRPDAKTFIPEKADTPAVSVRISKPADTERASTDEMDAFNAAFYEKTNVASAQAVQDASRSFEEISSQAVTESEYSDFSFDFDEDFWEQKDEWSDVDDNEAKDGLERDDAAERDSEAIESTPTEEQLRVITLPSSNRSIVSAGPGTGKTFTLIEKLKYMLQEQGIPSEDILVLSFSRAAVSVIEERLMAAVHNGRLTAPWQSLDIRTFDKFATWILYQGAQIKPESVPEPFLLGADDIPKLDYDQRIIAARNLVANWTGLFDGVSHVFIDETQDLVSPRADLVLAILENLPEECGFTLLGDSCQAIYDYGIYSGWGKGRKKKGISSADMIRRIEEGFTPIKLELTVNHRTKVTLPYSLDVLRHSLLTEDGEGARDAVDEVAGAYEGKVADIREIDKREIESAVSEGTLGILARYNGEALYVSSLLRNKSIAHRLRQAGRNEYISRIVADVFYDYEQDTIDKREFVAKAMAASGHSEEECVSAWYDLIEPCRNNMGSRYLVEDLLQALISSSKRSAFFVSEPECGSITVGTIHSAKGREFDTVWLAKDDLVHIAQSRDVDECKVGYVALSRPRRRLDLIQISASTRIKGYRDSGRRRHFSVPRSVVDGSAKAKLKRVSALEPINEIDIEFRSFGSKEAIQRTLKDACGQGDSLGLVKNPAAEGLYPTYTIYLESDEGKRPLGLLKPSFAKGFAIALSAINGGAKKGHAAPEFISNCPEAFDDLYIEDVITCIGGSHDAPPCAKRFGNKSIWYGLTITGLAKANRQSY